jgi:hypothetical protein
MNSIEKNKLYEWRGWRRIFHIVRARGRRRRRGKGEEKTQKHGELIKSLLAYFYSGVDTRGWRSRPYDFA